MEMFVGPSILAFGYSSGECCSGALSGGGVSWAMILAVLSRFLVQ